jgi:triphosphoribosyl-dephospho-CoA synthase
MNAEAARAAFLRACRLDVAVRKPGNVSLASAGHRMQAVMFLDSAEAAAAELFAPGATVGQRIEGAIAATWDAVGCNTNLGIVLLCAPIAAALEDVVVCAARAPSPRPSPASGRGSRAEPSFFSGGRAGEHGTRLAKLREATRFIVDRLDIADAGAAFRAIAMANPGGLGSVDDQDVHAAPTLDLQAAMRLAADRDRIAAQYGNGFEDVFVRGLGALPIGFDPRVDEDIAAPTVQALYMALLSAFEDSHIVRKHGFAVAHSVMRAAQAHGVSLAANALAAWDESLKSEGINPGTTADLTVATLFVAGLVHHGISEP